jgi:hypothetical protein
MELNKYSKPSLSRTNATGSTSLCWHGIGLTKKKDSSASSPDCKQLGYRREYVYALKRSLKEIKRRRMEKKILWSLIFYAARE